MGDISEIDLSSVPISALKSEARNVLSALLDPPKIFVTDQSLPRDWRGLALLTGEDNARFSYLSISGKPTAEVIHRWSQKSLQDANVEKLQEFLQQMDRFDVLDDVYELFESDGMVYLNCNLVSAPISENFTSSVKDNEILTKDDSHLAFIGNNQPQFYDAFVLYAKDDKDDTMFANELVRRMEAYGLKLCLEERDLVGGWSTQLSAILKLIAERCYRLIIVLSPSFVSLREFKFIVEFAVVWGIKEGRRKIIPCLFKPCDIQHSLSGFYYLNYNNTDGLVNFWEKLRDSLLVSHSERVTLGEIEDKNKSLSSLAPTVTTLQSIESLPSVSNLGKLNQNSSFLSTEDSQKSYSSMLDLQTNSDVSEITSIPSLGPRNNSNPSIGEKSQKKNWCKKFLKLGSNQKSKKKNKTKKQVLGE